MMCKEKLGGDDKELPDIGPSQTNGRWVTGSKVIRDGDQPLLLALFRVQKCTKEVQQGLSNALTPMHVLPLLSRKSKGWPMTGSLPMAECVLTRKVPLPFALSRPIRASGSFHRKVLSSPTVYATNFGMPILKKANQGSFRISRSTARASSRA
jgi:hypothetical protein